MVSKVVDRCKTKAIYSKDPLGGLGSAEHCRIR